MIRRPLALVALILWAGTCVFYFCKPDSSDSTSPSGQPAEHAVIRPDTDDAEALPGAASARVELAEHRPGIPSAEGFTRPLRFSDNVGDSGSRIEREGAKFPASRGGENPKPASASVNFGRPLRTSPSPSYSPAGANGRVTQSEVNALKDGLNQTLAAIEDNLAAQVFAETLPLVGNNFRGAWSNNVAGFRYLTTLRTAVVAGLSNLTGQADYAPTEVATAINSRLTNAGFNTGSQVSVTTLSDQAQLVFTTVDTFAAANVRIATNFGLPNLDLRLLGATNCQTVVTGSFNFTAGVDGGGFYVETGGAAFQFNTVSTISSLSTAVRFTQLPYRLTDVTTNRTSVPANFAIALKDPNSNGQLRVSELGGDLLDATITGNTKMSFRLLSSLPASAMMPQVGTDLRLLWNFNGVPVNPSDDNSTFGNVPLLTFDFNRINLDSFFNSFAGRALQQIDETTEPLQPVIDALTFEIPLLSDLGSDDVTILDLFDVNEETVDAIGGLAALLDLADLASSFSGNQSVFTDLGGYTLAGGDLRVDFLDDIHGAVARPPSSTRDADLNAFIADADAINGLNFPLLTDASVIAQLLLGRNATLFSYRSGEIGFDEQLGPLFFPVLGPVGITLGGHIGMKTEFGFGYDTKGIFDFYDDGGVNPDLLFNGFFALALDEVGGPLTGIELSFGVTAGVEANIVVASAGVEGDITATIGMYLDDQLGDADGRVRGDLLATLPVLDLFYAAGQLSAGLRAYLEIGWPPFGVSFEFESPRFVILDYDSRDDNVPVLAEPGQADPTRLVLNVGDRAHRRLVGQTNDVAEEFELAVGVQGLLVGAFGEENTFPDAFAQIVANSGDRGDLIEVQPDVTVPVLFTGGDGRDVLTGGAGADELNGGDGPDKLKGQGGNDLLRGDADNDELIGGFGADTLDGGAGDDTASWAYSPTPITMDLRTGTFTGEAALDTLISIERYKGTPLGDVMDGSESHDQLLNGGGGNDFIRGHGGDDLLEGDTGDDTLLGGGGNDMLNGGAGADTMDGGDGTDTLSYLAPGVPGLLPGIVGEPVTISLLTGLGTRGHADGDVVSNFEVLIGSGVPQGFTSPFGSGDDLTGSDNADIIHGMGGTDLIHGAGGNDVIYGNFAGVTNATLPGFDADTIYGEAGDDMLFGQDDDDKLFGGEGNDLLDGGTGDDDLDGNAGQDTLVGGEDNDHLFTFDLLSADVLDGGAGTNRLSADYSDKTNAMIFVVGISNGWTFPDGEQFQNLQTLGNLRTGSSNDVIRLSASLEYLRWSKTIDAGPGDDLVIADSREVYPTVLTRTADVFEGGEGNDTISFEQSIAGVTVSLASGNLGGAATGMAMSGFENIIGSEYVDTLTGNTNDNIFHPLRGRRSTDNNSDAINGSGGVDILVIDYSLDPDADAVGVGMESSAVTGYESINLRGGRSLHIYQGVERFFITGGAGNDILYGEGVTFSGVPYVGWSDRLLGGGGNDYIEARLGDDYVDGGAGNDTIEAGAGNDIVLGGPGDDQITFDYSDNSFSTYGTDITDAGPGDDIVTNIRFPGSDQTSANASTLFQFDGGDGVDTLQVDAGNMITPLIFDEAAPTEIILPNGGYLRNFERLAAITTGNANDVLILRGRFNNRIALRGGDDIINPGLGIDAVNAGSGNDFVMLDYSVSDDADTTGVTTVGGSTHERRRISDGALLDQINIASFERLHFTGSSKNDAAYGTGGDDIILSGAGNDTLTGNNGNDWLDGGPGADAMSGSSGNDTYIVDDPGDAIVNELSTWGTDTVRASISYTLSSTVEHLVLIGGALNGTGNSSSNQITGNALNNYLRGEGGNDLLNGGGGPNETDRLNGGANADTFVLSDAGVQFYDDGNPSAPGHNGYAIIEDFTPSQSDRLRLAGNTAQYFLSASPIVGVPGTALYHDSNGNNLLDLASDELIAILVSPETLTTTNTLANATYTQSVDPAVIGLTSPLAPGVVNDGSGPRFTVEFSIFEPMTNGVLLEIQASDDLGFGDPWLTIASKNGSGAWSGLATVTVSPPDNGRVTVSVRSLQPIVERTQQYFRARVTQP